MQNKPKINGKVVLVVLTIIVSVGLFVLPAKAQFLDPNNAMILNTLREISSRHYAGCK